MDFYGGILWSDNCFKTFDTDKSGNMNQGELRVSHKAKVVSQISATILSYAIDVGYQKKIETDLNILSILFHRASLVFY